MGFGLYTLSARLMSHLDLKISKTKVDRLLLVLLVAFDKICKTKRTQNGKLEKL